MSKVSFLNAGPLYLMPGIAFIRIIFGGLLVFHGLEVFNPVLMKEYATWEVFEGTPSGLFAYTGKSLELLAGLLFIFGLFTRIASLLTIGTFCYITFFIGNGKFWYQDQHPFMFVLLGILFLFTGPGAWSLDAFLYRKK
jgi:putative oxidoreductase